MAGSCSVCVCREGPVGDGGKMSLFLNWFDWTTDTRQHPASADSADCTGLCLTVTQRQQECDYSSWLKHWVCWEEENNSLIYLGHWIVSSLSATTGCEQPQLQLLADGFCRSKCSLPSARQPEQQDRRTEDTGLSLLWLRRARNYILTMFTCSAIRFFLLLLFPKAF